ncbi:hypothetical protein KCH_36270 [Kitasatospora cheerisanensis KCTC 2395]|uniref:Uncharacterized protein n=1 Tax=Kitasatospora cheerisanensis KCTC 2395 TaxID=1348663 RepID=A0A066Z2X7_9ACTN|nr:hypothetical protein KCH_36270 [Kitasatospora cheerisanensis KCTC 2395]
MWRGGRTRGGRAGPGRAAMASGDPGSRVGKPRVMKLLHSVFVQWKRKRAFHHIVWCPDQA